MRKQIHIIFLVIILTAIHQTAFAVIAYPYPVEIIQPDGTKITIIQKGDEHVKWAQTTDGFSIMRNNKGLFEYAKLSAANDMVPSGILARNQSLRSSTDNQFLNITGKGLTYSRSQVVMMKSLSAFNEKSSQSVMPITGRKKLVCILIGFTDKAFTKTKADFENLFNQVGYNADGATGSVHDFYKENSFGQLDLSVTVAGPYTAAHNMAYYGANDGINNDVNPKELITEAVTLADLDLNYADFDNDNDGSVDGVYVIYAGYGEEAGGGADAIWSHAWNITPLTLDGKIVSKYSCSSELRENKGTGITRIGAICHEFGHTFGATDFYDTDYTTSGQYDGTGKWDVMGSGSWNNMGVTPAHHNSYTKIYTYGWAKATVLASDTAIMLNDAEQHGNSFYRINKATPNEFFLLENRQQQKFDSYIPGHGLIIYNVDGNFIGGAGNKINASDHQGMYPVCANAAGTPPDYGVINSGGLPFPGTGNKTTFTDETSPNTLSWAGARTNKPITNISENTADHTISFNFGINTTAPTATTIAAYGISASTALLKAQVDAYNAATTVSFEFGTTPDYGTTVNATPDAVTGSLVTDITAALKGLNGNTTYNYRVKAINSIGTTYGDNMTFTTAANFVIPTLTTTVVTSITETTVISGGEITAFGGAMVTAKGICWSATENPTAALSTRTTDGTGSGTFTSNITGLSPGTTYHARAYATTVAGTGYGADVVFITNASPAVPPKLTESVLKSLSAYPNPVAVSFTLKTSEVTNCKADVRIINSAGTKVMEFQAENQKYEILKTIPVSNLNPGIYIVQVLLDNKSLYNTKIIVTK